MTVYKILIIAISLIIMTITASAQINFEQSTSINQDGADLHASAILDLKSSEEGLLIPRMTSTQRTAITGTEGLMIYDTTSDSFWYHDGSSWSEIGAGGAFENVNNVVRSTGDHGTDGFIFGAIDFPTDTTEERLFFFDKTKGAVRGGLIEESSNWNQDSLGENLFAYGKNRLVKGDNGIALGWGARAIRNNSVAIGVFSTAEGSSAIALGVQYCL